MILIINIVICPGVLLDVLNQQRIGVEYQPLISASSGDVVAYEALARFRDAGGKALSPEAVFEALHDSPLTLYQMELLAKQIQLAHAPTGGLYVNLDPDAYAAGVPADGGRHPLIDLLASRASVVVEIIENSSVSDAALSERMAGECAARGMQLALDDVGAPESMLSLPLLMRVDCVKFDRSWWRHWQCARHQAMLRALVGLAREHGQTTVLEGVETGEQRELAIALGVDLLQGFLYRPLFRQHG